MSSRHFRCNLRLLTFSLLSNLIQLTLVRNLKQPSLPKSPNRYPALRHLRWDLLMTIQPWQVFKRLSTTRAKKKNLARKTKIGKKISTFSAKNLTSFDEVADTSNFLSLLVTGAFQKVQTKKVRKPYPAPRSDVEMNELLLVFNFSRFVLILELCDFAV